MNDNLTNKTSANAVANGFEFEFAAALLIYLEHLKEAKLIGTEKKDDIYLVLKNGDKVYGQAKSSLEADAIANTHFPEIIDSLRTLAKNNDDAKKLISIFNFYRPFGDRDSFAHESNYDIKSYNELTTKTKKKLKESIKGKYDIDFDKLEFWFFRFEGQNALTSLKSYIREKLSDIDSIGHFNIDNLISCWILLIMENARNKKMMISSDVMVGNLFSKIIESSSGFESIIKFAGFENDIGFVDEELLKDVDKVLPSNVEKRWDDNLKQYYVEYTQNGAVYKMWVEDTTSISAKLDLINEYKLAGAAYWEKDRESPEVWDIVKEKLFGN